MARATDQQVQTYANERIRPRAELVRRLQILLNDDKSSIGDVFAHVSGADSIAPTWEDNRQDGPPTLLTPNKVLEYNAFMQNLLDILAGTLQSDAAKAAACNVVAGNLASVLSACVRPPDVIG